MSSCEEKLPQQESSERTTFRLARSPWVLLGGFLAFVDEQQRRTRLADRLGQSRVELSHGLLRFGDFLCCLFSFDGEQVERQAYEREW